MARKKNVSDQAAIDAAMRKVYRMCQSRGCVRGVDMTQMGPTWREAKKAAGSTKAGKFGALIKNHGGKHGIFLLNPNECGFLHNVKSPRASKDIVVKALCRAPQHADIVLNAIGSVSLPTIVQYLHLTRLFSRSELKEAVQQANEGYFRDAPGNHTTESLLEEIDALSDDAFSPSTRSWPARISAAIAIDENGFVRAPRKKQLTLRSNKGKGDAEDIVGVECASDSAEAQPAAPAATPTAAPATPAQIQNAAIDAVTKAEIFYLLNARAMDLYHIGEARRQCVRFDSNMSVVHAREGIPQPIHEQQAQLLLRVPKIDGEHDSELELLLNTMPHNLADMIRSVVTQLRQNTPDGDAIPLIFEFVFDIGSPPRIRFVGNTDALGSQRICDTGEYIELSSYKEQLDVQSDSESVSEWSEWSEEGQNYTEVTKDVIRSLLRSLRDANMGELYPEGAPDDHDADDYHTLQADMSNLFSTDNRAGIPDCLHRISRYQNRMATTTIGLTYRVGRFLPGVSRIFSDVLHDLIPQPGQPDKPKSLLILGPPGAGKTTILRDIVSIMGQRFGPAVVIVDTSSEIGGLGDKPHEVVRKSRVRRVPVHDREKQHQVLLEVVQNHSPSVIVVDEIRDRKEATVVRTIANRGVSVIATAHGTTLQDLLDNNELNSVAGGANSVIYSAKEVEDRRKKAGPRTGAADEGKKTGLNRKEAPVFDIAIEVVQRNVFRVYKDVASAVDTLLSGGVPDSELRWPSDNDGEFVIDWSSVSTPEVAMRYPFPRGMGAGGSADVAADSGAGVSGAQ